MRSICSSAGSSASHLFLAVPLVVPSAVSFLILGSTVRKCQSVKYPWELCSEMVICEKTRKCLGNAFRGKNALEIHFFRGMPRECNPRNDQVRGIP